MFTEKKQMQKSQNNENKATMEVNRAQLLKLPVGLLSSLCKSSESK